MKTCERCTKNELAVNYHRNGKTYYRKVCNSCAREDRESRTRERKLLAKSGYKIKMQCDRCGFRAKTRSQMKLHYLDGNKHNVALSNLRSYCLNCTAEVNSAGFKRHQLVADF